MTWSARIGTLLAVRSVGELAILPLAFFFYLTAIAGSYQAPWAQSSRLAWIATVPAEAIARQLSPAAREQWRAAVAALRIDIRAEAVTSEAIWGRLKKMVDPRQWRVREAGRDLTATTGYTLVFFAWVICGGLLFGVAIPVGLSRAIAPYARREFGVLYMTWRRSHR